MPSVSRSAQGIACTHKTRVCMCSCAHAPRSPGQAWEVVTPLLVLNVVCLSTGVTAGMIEWYDEDECGVLGAVGACTVGLLAPATYAEVMVAFTALGEVADSYRAAALPSIIVLVCDPPPSCAAGALPHATLCCQCTKQGVVALGSFIQCAGQTASLRHDYYMDSYIRVS